MRLNAASAAVIAAILTLLGTVFTVVWSTQSASGDDLKYTIEQLNDNNKELTKAINDLRERIAHLEGMHNTAKPVAKMFLPPVKQSRTENLPPIVVLDAMVNKIDGNKIP